MAATVVPNRAKRASKEQRAKSNKSKKKEARKKYKSI
jgi:hypothetical protein